MTEPHPVEDLNEVLKKWQQIKDEIQDVECAGETWDFLSEWSSETGIAQHALWRGCETIVGLCCQINKQINLSYPHPIKGCVTPGVDDATIEILRKVESEIYKCLNLNKGQYLTIESIFANMIAKLREREP